jgi:hypothetical protein
MYAGHVGVALGAHGIRRAIPLWFLVITSQLPDWADAAFCLAGIRPLPLGILSHSIPAVGSLALIAALVYVIAWRDPAGVLIVVAVVVSHAVGDYFTGIKPTWPGGPMIGLELYKQPFVDLAMESAIIIGGWAVYRKSLPVERQSSRPMFTVLGALLAIQIAADIVLTFAKGLRKC